MSLADFIHWSFAPLRYIVSIAKWLLSPLESELPSILPRGVLDRLEDSVFFLTDDGNSTGKPIGVGFCIGNRQRAITAHHNFISPRVNSKVQGFFGAPRLGQYLDMVITYESAPLDLVILRIEHSSFSNRSLQVSNLIPTMRTICVLVAFQISPYKQSISDIETRYEVSVIRGFVERCHSYHFTYDTSCFSGETGGAVIILDGLVIGMHVETVNQARERLLRALTVKGRLDDVEQSVDSLVKRSASGCIAIKASLFYQMV